MPLIFATSNEEFQILKDEACEQLAGGKVSFVGCVRRFNHGKEVAFLAYEAHEPLAKSLFAELEDVAKERFGILASFAVHRVGRVEVGHDAVKIRVLAQHRHEAFLAARFLIDELKKTLPIWKKEVYSDGGHTWDQTGCHCAPEHQVESIMMQPVKRALMAKAVDFEELQKKRVVLVGAGGLGCPMAINLCALGIVRLSIVDGDSVSASNLARQYAYRATDQGEKKARLLKQFIEERYHFSSINAHEEFIDEKRAHVFFQDADLVIDATDCPITKSMLKKVAFKEKIPFISASVHQQDGEVQAYVPGTGACLDCFSEGPLSVSQSCASVGVLTHVCQIVAAVASERALSLLQGGVVTTSEMSVVDPQHGIKTFAIFPDERCATCSPTACASPKKKLVRLMR